MELHKIENKISSIESRNKFLTAQLYLDVNHLFEEINTQTVKNLPLDKQLEINLNALNRGLKKATELKLIFTIKTNTTDEEIIVLSSVEGIKEEDLRRLLKGDSIPVLAEDEIFNDEDFLSDLFLDEESNTAEILENLSEDMMSKIKNKDDDNIFSTINKKASAQDEELALKIKEAVEKSEDYYQNLLKRIEMEQKNKKTSSIRRK